MALDLESFNERDVTEVTEWVRLTQCMIAMDPELNRNTLKRAVANIADRCNDRWPLERGGSLTLTEGDLGVDMSAFGENVTVTFAGKTALCLFAGVDGPHVTASVLLDGIDDLADAIEREE